MSIVRGKPEEEIKAYQVSNHFVKDGNKLNLDEWKLNEDGLYCKNSKFPMEKHINARKRIYLSPTNFIRLMFVYLKKLCILVSYGKIRK